MRVKMDAGCGMRDDRTCNGGIRNKNTSTRAGFAYLIGGMLDSFKIDNGKRDV